MPAFNESEQVGGVVADIRAHAPWLDVLVVDDGSWDGTVEAARTAGADAVVRLPVNLGIGGAVQTGLRWAVRHGYDAAIQIDGDGQHLASETARLREAFETGGWDLVVGTRFADVRSFESTPMRRLGSWILGRIARLATHLPFTDVTSGFRLTAGDALPFLAEHYPPDYPEPESLVLLSRNRFRMTEVPVRMQSRRGGRSSITPLRSAHYMLKVSLAMLLARLRLSEPVRRPE